MGSLEMIGRRSNPALCYVLPEYDPNTTTHLAHVYELLERVSERIEIVLVVGHARGPVTLCRLRAVFVVPEGGLVRRSLGFLAALVRARAMGCRQFYVHYHVLAGLLAILICRLSRGTSYFWTCVETRRYFARLSWKPTTWGRLLLMDLPRSLVIKGAQRLVTCNEHMAEYYVQAFEVPRHRIAVFPNWVNLNRFRQSEGSPQEARTRLGIPSKVKVLLFVHTIGEHKGAHWLCPIVEHVRRRVPEVMLLVVGTGPYLPRLGHEVKARGLEGQMVIIGGVPNRELGVYFDAADLLINPASVEEFGRILLEAMAAGLPFVSTDGGGGVRCFLTELQRTCLVPPEKPETFGDKVVELLLNDGLRKRLVQEGLVQVADYSLDRAVEQFLTLVGDRQWLAAQDEHR